jgi:hypothetical protein
MPYTVEDGGRLNSFAAEPRMYRSEPADNAQKLTYAITAVVTVVLVVGLVAIAKFASGSV